MKNYYWEVRIVHQAYELQKIVSEIQEKGIWTIDQITKDGLSWLIIVRKEK